ncbi:MAG: panthothenate synthetase [SAR202 cluster bacterium Io17-Chloro-G9]|nr:MAG: panthothenate synthetase [SAR202 cluster bacterium Io17-Chloro-G9]
MRMLVDFNFPLEPFNTLVRNGTAGQKIEQIMNDIKPEAAYFSERGGKRGGIIIVDVADPSKLPAIAEPFFLTFNASVEFHVVMSPEDLGNAGLDDLGKKYS